MPCRCCNVSTGWQVASTNSIREIAVRRGALARPAGFCKGYTAMGKESRSWREEKLAEHFFQWELRGRGWRIFEHAVALKPPFLPFAGYFSPASSGCGHRTQAHRSAL